MVGTLSFLFCALSLLVIPGLHSRSLIIFNAFCKRISIVFATFITSPFIFRHQRCRLAALYSNAVCRILFYHIPIKFVTIPSISVTAWPNSNPNRPITFLNLFLVQGKGLPEASALHQERQRRIPFPPGSQRRSPGMYLMGCQGRKP